jgi:hypothetical protein
MDTADTGHCSNQLAKKAALISVKNLLPRHFLCLLGLKKQTNCGRYESLFAEATASRGSINARVFRPLSRGVSFRSRPAVSQLLCSRKCKYGEEAIYNFFTRGDKVHLLRKRQDEVGQGAGGLQGLQGRRWVIYKPWNFHQIRELLSRIVFLHRRISSLFRFIAAFYKRFAVRYLQPSPHSHSLVDCRPSFEGVAFPVGMGECTLFES